MAKIAVDIALLLPKEINDICVDINQKKDSDAYSNLSKKNNYPHITLAMGVIDEKDLPKIKERLKIISEKFRRLDLEIVELHPEITPEKKVSQIFNIKRTKKLVELHETIMNELFSFLSHDSNEKCFFVDKDEKFSEVTTFWVNNYHKKYKHPENFSPHISLKCRKGEFGKPPLKFTASTLAICHLGNYCTCRTVLGKFELNSKQSL